MGRSSSKGKGRKKAKKEPIKNESHFNPDIAGIIYMASGLVLAIAIYTNLAGVLSNIAQKLSYAFTL